jgi:putative tricarboxylic transport membrane protein
LIDRLDPPPFSQEYLRHALLLSRGDPTVFVRRPLSAAMLALAAVGMFLVLSPAIRKKREEAFTEET